MNIYYLISVLLFPQFVLAAPQSWQVPVELSDSNVTVTFEVDSTWHLVKGKTKNVVGKIWLADVKDPTSIRAEIRIPVQNFDTDNTKRDGQLRQVMAEESYPNVEILITKNDTQCTPQTVLQNQSCQAQMYGTLSIRDVKKEVTLPYTITKESEGYRISGSTSLQWAAYHVEDPSILIAKLDKTVVVKFSCTLKEKQNV